MLVSEMPFGQTASHSPSFEQAPKPFGRPSARPSASTRVPRSTCPCGNSARCVIFGRGEQGRRRVLARRHAGAAADALGRVEGGFGDVLGDGQAVAIRSAADVDRRVAAGLDDAVEGAAIDHQVAQTGKARARQGSRVSVSPSLKRRMCSWQTVVHASGPCGRPLTRNPHVPQMPSRQSESNAIGSSPLRIRPSLTTSSISRNDMSGEMWSAV